VLEAVLHRLGAYLEQSARLRRTVVGALAYPVCRTSWSCRVSSTRAWRDAAPAASASIRSSA
jgi:hypothetical protein